MDNFIKNIKRNSFKELLLCLLYCVIISALLAFFTNLFINEITSSTNIFKLFNFQNFIAILFFIALLLLDSYLIYLVCKNFILYNNPKKCCIFNKFSDINEVINNINNNILYEDNICILSEKYILNKKDYRCIMDYNDILGVYIEIHKTNFTIDEYKIVLTDKYNETLILSYSPNKKNTIYYLINYLSTLCKNAKFGYSAETMKYIKNNINIDYSTNNKNISFEDYLEKNFKATGTRTNVTEIRANNVIPEVQEIMNSSEKLDNIIKGKEKVSSELFIGKENPYTSKIIQNYNDIILYFRMYQLDCKGIDPLTILESKYEEEK